MPRHGVYHSLVTAFKTELIKRALGATGSNRTHAARLLGLQRTYLLRLMRELAVDVPVSGQNGRGAQAAPTFEARLPGLRIEITGWESEPPKDGDDGRPGGATVPNPGGLVRGQPARQTREPASCDR
jgi:hypothetical protein